MENYRVENQRVESQRVENYRAENHRAEAEGVSRVLDEFNAFPAARAHEALMAVCASEAWAGAVAAARPYFSRDDLTAAAEAAFTRLTWADVAQAVAAHPKIGQRPLGAGREAAWSRREQAGVEGAREALAEMNRAYEERFGHTFLIFASGKTASEILTAARERLANDDETERAVVRKELRKIVRRRLEKLVDARINDRPGHVGVSTHVLDNARGEPARGVPVLLQRDTGEGWQTIASGRTDCDGRLRNWVASDDWRAGTYRLVFDTAAYLGPDAFFPEVNVVFRVSDPARHHHHVPLLLSPFGYTTYRGS